MTDGLAELYYEVAGAEQALRQLRGQLDAQLLRYDLAERQFVSGVDHLSQGEPDTVRSLGYEARIGRTATGAHLEAPAGLIARPGTEPGTVQLVWKKVVGAKSYSLQMSADPITERSWVDRLPETRRRATLGDLQGRVRYWFRVATLGAGGQSPWSEPVTAIAR